MRCVIEHRLFVVTRSNLMSCISQYCTPSSHVLHSAEVFLSGVMLAWLSAWGADLHVAQLMPLPLTVSCFSKIQIGFYLSVTGSPVLSRQDKEPLIVCVCACTEVFQERWRRHIHRCCRRRRSRESSEHSFSGRWSLWSPAADGAAVFRSVGHERFMVCQVRLVSCNSTTVIGL